MNSDYEAILIIGAVLLAVVAIRLGARMNNILGRILRGWWNINFKLAAYIPFCGWMSRLIIADTTEEKLAKDAYVRKGAKTDDAAYDYVGKKSAAELRRLEEEARINSLVRAKYGSELSSYDSSTGTAYLRNGKTVHIERE